MTAYHKDVEAKTNAYANLISSPETVPSAATWTPSPVTQFCTLISPSGVQVLLTLWSSNQNEPKIS